MKTAFAVIIPTICVGTHYDILLAGERRLKGMMMESGSSFKGIWQRLQRGIADIIDVGEKGAQH
jgi:hypothetical protein